MKSWLKGKVWSRYLLNDTFLQSVGGLYDSIPTEEQLYRAIGSESYYCWLCDHAHNAAHGEYVQNLDLALWYVQTTNCSAGTALDEISTLCI